MIVEAKNRPMQTRLYRMGGLAALAGLILLASACDARREVQMATFEVTRVSWDTVLVDLAFHERAAVGRSRSIEATDVVVRAFDGAYEMVFEGPGPVVLLPDGRMGSRERIVVEACGSIQGNEICDQRMLEASPKRIQFQEELTYPRLGRYDQGMYDFAFAIERKVFGAEQWEAVPGEPAVSGYLVASVGGRPETSVKVPLNSAQGQFDLSQHNNYPEFRFRVLRALQEADEAPVQIDLFAGLDDQPVRLATLQRIVRDKSPQERERELEKIVRASAERILSRFEPYDRAQAHVRGWRFNDTTRQYRIQLALVWGQLFGGRQRVEGDLEISEDGSDAVFTRTGTNPRTRRAWRERVGEDALELGRIDLDTDADSEEEPVAMRL